MLPYETEKPHPKLGAAHFVFCETVLFAKRSHHGYTPPGATRRTQSWVRLVFYSLAAAVVLVLILTVLAVLIALTILIILIILVVLVVLIILVVLVAVLLAVFVFVIAHSLTLLRFLSGYIIFCEGETCSPFVVFIIRQSTAFYTFRAKTRRIFAFSN